MGDRWGSAGTLARACSESSSAETVGGTRISGTIGKNKEEKGMQVKGKEIQ